MLGGRIAHRPVDAVAGDVVGLGIQVFFGVGHGSGLINGEGSALAKGCYSIRTAEPVVFGTARDTDGGTVFGGAILPLPGSGPLHFDPRPFAGRRQRITIRFILPLSHAYAYRHR